MIKCLPENIQGKNAELGNDMDVKNLGWVRTIVLSWEEQQKIGSL